jgi:hypothetical protein
MAVDTNAEAFARIRAILDTGDFGKFNELGLELMAEDIVEEYPQSGEVFRGRSTIQTMNEAYPSATGTQPTLKLRRFRSEGSLGVVEATVDYGDGTPVSWVAIAELRDGRVVRLTDYFGSPFEAPEWRRKFTAG